jgi:hypothetical protein
MESAVADDDADDALLAMQGIANADWVVPANARLARETNDMVRALADREMEPGLSPADFTKLLIAAALRAEADAASRA